MVEVNKSNGAQEQEQEYKVKLTIDINGKGDTVNGEGVIAVVNMGESDDKAKTAVIVGGHIDTRTVVNLLRHVVHIAGFEATIAALMTAASKQEDEVEGEHL